MKLRFLPAALATFLLLPMLMGCSLVPETRQRDRLHNPFPQLKRVAILPFFNQSNEPTLDTEVVTEQYYAALQAIPGFEVMPIGVSKIHFMQHVLQYGEPRTGEEFQRLAQSMGVEALVVGSVTDFEAYYPPRMAMTVNWYAANEGFHPIPAGYGLPWGTEHEKHIPKRIVDDAEFELARSQLATQSPLPATPASATVPRNSVPKTVGPETVPVPPADPSDTDNGEPSQERSPTIESPSDADSEVMPLPPPVPEELDQVSFEDSGAVELHRPVESSITDLPPTRHVHGSDQFHSADQFHADPWLEQLGGAPLPADWPDPTDLIPDPPLPHRPMATINREPVLSHTRIYRGDDPYFTNRLADHVETGDDARPGGWQGYLRRSDDFIRFCCHLHITEMLESRGGSDQSDLILRWPVSRY